MAGAKGRGVFAARQFVRVETVIEGKAIEYTVLLTLRRDELLSELAPGCSSLRQ